MITVKITDGGVKQALSRISQRMSDPSPVMLAIAEALQAQTDDNFANQSGPLGKWPALKSPKKGRGTNPQILVHIGHLKASIGTTHSRNTAAIGTNLVYAAVHQFGGKINMPARSQLSYFKQQKDGSVGRLFVRKSASNFAQWHTRGESTINMPARPFLPFANGKLQDGMESRIMAEIAKFLIGD